MKKKYSEKDLRIYLSEFIEWADKEEWYYEPANKQWVSYELEQKISTNQLMDKYFESF